MQAKNSLNYYQEILRKGNLEYFDKQKNIKKNQKSHKENRRKRTRSKRRGRNLEEKLDGKWHVIGLYDKPRICSI